MSDASDADPDDWTDLETELDYWGKATKRTGEPVTFVDSICVVCGNYTVSNVRHHAREWKEGQTFGDYCRVCSADRPHNIVAFRTGTNRNHDRGYLNPKGGYAPGSYEYAHLDDYDAWNDDNGIEQCPGCEELFTGNGGYLGEVYDTEGTHYESVLDADPEDRLYCPDCWKDHLNARREVQNEPLDGYGDGGDVDGQ